MDIKKIIREELEEIRTTQKVKYGQGMEHSIYPSSKYPDRLLKIGEKEVVEEWVKIFKSDTKNFPKIFRVGKLSNYEHNNSEVFFVEIEKLDTDKATKEWDYLHEKMEETGIVDDDFGLYGRDFTDIYLNHGDDRDIIKSVLLSLKEYDQKAYDIFLNWFSTVKDCENAKNKVVGHESLVDAHKYNFGYGKDGQLKCLDI